MSNFEETKNINIYKKKNVTKIYKKFIKNFKINKIIFSPPNIYF